MTTQHFSAALHAELASSLEAYASTIGSPREHDRLRAAMDRVWREAHANGMSPESMVIAIRSACLPVPAVQRNDDGLLRGAYDWLMSECIQGYFRDYPH